MFTVKFISRIKFAYSAVSIALILLGLCFAVLPEISAVTMCYCLGIIVIVFGIIKIMGYFSKDVYRLAFQFDLAFGIAMIICGTVTLINPRILLGMFPVFIGIFVLVDGLFKIQTAFDSKRFGLS